jgi:hypothetical protein
LPDSTKVDQILELIGTQTLKELAAFRNKPIQAEPKSKDEELEFQSIPPAFWQTIQQCCDELYQYFKDNTADPKLVQVLHLFEGFLHQKQHK